MNRQTNTGDSANRPRGERADRQIPDDTEFAEDADDDGDFAEEHQPSPSDPPVARLHVDYDDSFDDPTGV